MLTVKSHLCDNQGNTNVLVYTLILLKITISYINNDHKNYLKYQQNIITHNHNSKHGRLARRIKWRPLLILQTFRHSTYVTTHSPTPPSLYLRHSSFSKTSVASPTSQFILHPFFRFSYVTSSSLNSPGEPSMLSTLCRTWVKKVLLTYYSFTPQSKHKTIYILIPGF